VSTPPAPTASQIREQHCVVVPAAGSLLTRAACGQVPGTVVER
jgi:hypothetical protein